MRNLSRWFALSLLAVTLPAVAVVMPMRIPFQGKLIDPATNNPKNGPQSMVFKIWDAPTGGNQLFSEPQTVTVVNGVFSVQIGTINYLSADMLSGTSAYLGVTVGADSEMLPRQPLSMSPYAYTALQLASDKDIRINSGVAYTTFTNTGNWEFPYGMSAGSAAITGNSFAVGGSSFVVAGGSATVGYRLQAGSLLTTASMTASGFFGNGSAMTGVINSSSFSVSDQAVPAATLTLLRGSQIAVPAGKIQVGTVFKWTFAVSKTAAGTAARSFFIKVGTLGTTADATVATLTTGVGTAVIDKGMGTVMFTIRGPLTASCLGAAHLQLTHNLATTGLLTIAANNIGVAPTTAFNATTANLFVSLALTSGTAEVLTFQQMVAETLNLRQ